MSTSPRLEAARVAFSALQSAVRAPLRTLDSWLAGLVGLGQLAWRALQKLRAGERPIGPALLAELIQPRGQRWVFAALRAFQPNLVLGIPLCRAYECSGTALITRREDVLSVLSRDEDFEVVYGPRMRELSGGEDFILGMQPGWPYERDVSALRLVARRSDVAEIIAPRAAQRAREIVEKSEGELDAVQQLTQIVPADMVAHYFGLPGGSLEKMIESTTILFWYLFFDLPADPEVERRALPAAAELRDFLDQAITERQKQIRSRKKGATAQDDVLARCLALQRARTPGMETERIRTNLFSLAIGAIPTLSRAAALALDVLLDRPYELAQVREAARRGDAALTGRYVFEALRFNPHNPVIYRRARRDAVVARSTLRERTIPKGTLVFASNASAMFDALHVPDASSFRVDRPESTYLHWGYGLHECFGGAINRGVLPEMLMPLLRQANLRRADGAAGQLQSGNTPFPQHLHVRFDTE